MIIIYIISWAFLAFVFSGFAYLLFQWILVKEGNYAFKNKKERVSLISKRLIFMLGLLGVIVFLISSSNSLPYRSVQESDYVPGQELPWK